jgi:hypothetical protein
MYNEEMLLKLYQISTVSVRYGKSKSKIDAINRDLSEFIVAVNTYKLPIPDVQIIINMSDDMVFIEKGFDNIIRESFDNFDQCLHFPDGNRTDLITLSILGIDFYKRFNYIYYPEYLSFWADNEQTEIAKMLGCYKFIDKHIFNHLHPGFQKAVMDDQYRRDEPFTSVDYTLYEQRKEIKFGLVC